MNNIALLCTKNEQIGDLHNVAVSPTCPQPVPLKMVGVGDSAKANSEAGLRVSVPNVPLKYLLPFWIINSGIGTVQKDSMYIGLGEKDSETLGTVGDNALPNRRRAARLLSYRLSHYPICLLGTLLLFNHHFWYVCTSSLLAVFCRSKIVQFNTISTMYLACNKTGGHNRD